MEKNTYTLRQALRYLRVRSVFAPDHLVAPLSVTLTDGRTADLVNANASDGGTLLGAYEIRLYTRGGQWVKTYRAR